MSDMQIAVVGIGATGSVLAAALLSRAPGTILVASRPTVRDHLLASGLEVTGPLAYRVAAGRVVAGIGGLAGLEPEVVVLCTKTFHLPRVLDELGGVFRPGMKIVSAHNGLGPEDLIAERFGADAVLRMSLTFGASSKAPGRADTAFFNKPNHLGSLTPTSREAGSRLARMLTAGGMDTELVDDIKLFVWKKMIAKCTMASICAVTDRSIKEALEYPPTREIADQCFREILAVAKAMGYDVGEAYLNRTVAYLAEVGVHKDSMCHDVAAGRPTEIDFLGGKVVEYARRKGVPVPACAVMTNLVKAIEDSYLRPGVD